MASPPPGKPFPSGQSGNPGGRPRMPAEVRNLARSYTVEALETAAEIMRDAEAPAVARMSAINTLLDRGWGKPPQHITTENLEALTDADLRDELAAAVAELRRHGLDGAGEGPARGNGPPPRTH